MPTSATYNWIYLGTAPSIDPTENNTVAENASTLVGSTYGTTTNPLYNHMTSVVYNDIGGTAGAIDQDNRSSNDQFTTNIGAGSTTYTFDATSIYDATITYADGTTATVTAVLAQSTTGQLFLAPESTASNVDTAAYEAKPILSIQLNALTGGVNNYAGLSTTRILTGFDNGIVDGTAGNDLINGAYVEPIANGSDKIDNGDGTTGAANGWNDDVVLAGAGNDTINAGLGADSIDAGAGDDLVQLTGVFGNDTIIGGETTETTGDTIDATALTANETLTFTGGEAGTLSSGTSTATFSQIERFQLGSGNDTVNGAAATLAMYVDAGAGADSLLGGSAADTLIGGTGNDTLNGGAGVDSLDGGAGDDTFVLSGTFGNDSITGGETSETIGDTIDATALTANETLTFTGGEAGTLSSGTSTATFSQIERFQLGSGNDTVNGAAATLAMYVDAGTGADSVLGGSAADTLIGGIGADTVDGGAGADSIDGGDGNDSLSGGTGAFADTIVGGNGNDTIDGGDGNDSLLGGAGLDSIVAGAGDDYVDGGTEADSIAGGDGNDSLFGGAGAFADTIDGGNGNDTIDGGDGNDSLLGGDGNDSISGGAGDDTILFGAGNDTVSGGDGNDFIDDAVGSVLVGDNLLDGGAGNDTIFAGGGQDTLLGGANDDSLYGEDGNDSLDGGDGNDALDGGAGNDTLNGGAGADTLTGGLGNDLFTGLGIGDVVIGSEDPGNTDTDVLDLFGSGWDKTTTNIIFTGPGKENGTVQFLNNLGQVIGTMSFSNIEKIIPCFTPGALIETGSGSVPVETLRVGDRVQTRDAGLQRISWIGHRDVTLLERTAKPELLPVLIRRGALGPDQPARDIYVSPQHRILFTGYEAELIAAECEVLVAAKYLVGQPGIERASPARPVHYLHLMFERHEILRSDGIWSESYQPGETTLAGLGSSQRGELITLFPDLATQSGLARYAAARYSLKSFEARALTLGASAG